MKKKIPFLVFILLAQFAYAQKAGNNWCFGDSCGLDFSTRPPTKFKSSINTLEGCATISDNRTGHLLFYSDGHSVWDRNHHLMPSFLNGHLNGGGGSSTQAALIVPDPSSLSKYYLFTCDQAVGISGLQYVEIDMTLNNGLGNISSSSINQLVTPVSEKLTATRNSNGNDFWITVHKWNSDSFFVYPLTINGVGLPVISKIGIIDPSEIGYMKVSPNSRKIAALFYGKNKLEIFDFNPSNGIISNPIIDSSFGVDISNSTGLYGLAFSPDSKKLYVSYI